MMTQSELQKILGERIKIANDKSLSLEERQAEDEITQTILKVAQFIFNDNSQTAETAQLPSNQNKKAEPFVNQYAVTDHKLSADNQSSYSNKHKYPFESEHKLWLIENFRMQASIEALTRAYNERFNTNVSSHFIREKCRFYRFIL